MPHYTIAVFDGDDMTDENIGRIVLLLSENGVKTIYNFDGKDINITDVTHYLKLVEPGSHEAHQEPS